MARRTACLEAEGSGGTVDIALHLVNQRILQYRQEPPDCPETLEMQVVENQQPDFNNSRNNCLLAELSKCPIGH